MMLPKVGSLYLASVSFCFWTLISYPEKKNKIQPRWVSCRGHLMAMNGYIYHTQGFFHRKYIAPALKTIVLGILFSHLLYPKSWFGILPLEMRNREETYFWVSPRAVSLCICSWPVGGRADPYLAMSFFFDGLSFWYVEDLSLKIVAFCQVPVKFCLLHILQVLHRMSKKTYWCHQYTVFWKRPCKI